MTTAITPQNNNLIPTQARLKDLLDYFGKYLKIQFNCHHIATIQTFDPLTQTATVTINYSKTFLQADKGIISTALNQYPPIDDVPVIFLGGGDANLTFPVGVGDECILLFNDRDIDNWFSGSTSTPPNTARLHSFTDAVALVGLRSLANVIKNFDMARAVLRKGSAMVGVGAGGGSLVKIANATLTLGTLLQNLSTQLENLTSQLQTLTTDIAAITVICAAPSNPSSIPVNSAAFITLGTSIGTIGSNISSIATQMGELLE
jgi:hypothetical protein